MLQVLPACCNQWVVLPVHRQAVKAVSAHRHPTTCFSSLYRAVGRAGSHLSRPRAAFEGEAMVAQQLCFHASGVRPRNIEPGLNSAPSFLPSKARAASGRGVQTCWGGCEKMAGAWSHCLSQAQWCDPSTFLRTLSSTPGIKTSLKPTWICHESVDEPLLSLKPWALLLLVPQTTRMRLLGSALTLNGPVCAVLRWLLHPMAHIHPSKKLHCFHGDDPVLVHHCSSACLALSGFSTENEGDSPGLSYSSQKSHAVQDAAVSPFCSMWRGHTLTTLPGQNAASGKGRHEHRSDATLRSSVTPSALEEIGGVGAMSAQQGAHSSLSDIKL